MAKEKLKPAPIEAVREECPINEAANEAASFYSNYWDEFISDHPALAQEYEEFIPVARHTDKTRRRMEDEINRLWDRPGIDASTEAKNFYYRLGSLNQMQGAGEITARTGMVLERCADMQLERGQANDYERFLSGCLFHESGLVSSGNLRASMLSRALSQYTRLINDNHNNLTSAHVSRALRYSYDIQFLRIYDEIRASEPYTAKLQSMHEELQLAYIDEFLEYVRQVEAHENDLRLAIEEADTNTERSNLNKQLSGNQKGFRGTAFEWYALLSYRWHIDKKTLHDKAYIRSALPREEEPKFYKAKKCDRVGKRDTKQMPKHGFDSLLFRYNKHGERDLRRLQFKLNSSNKYSVEDNDTQEYKYLPEIDIMTSGYRERGKHEKGREPDLLPIFKQSAIAMKKEYTNQLLDKKDKEALESMADLVHSRLAA